MFELRTVRSRIGVQLLATVIADQAGHVSYLATIPADTPAGQHHFELVGLSSAVVAVTDFFTVTAAPVAPTTTTTVPGSTTIPVVPTTTAGSVTSQGGSVATTTSTGSLPVTGAAISGLLVAGVALLATGAVLLAGSRRRSS